MDFTKYKQAYLCGDMLHKSLFEYRQKQKDELEGIEGIEVYNPSSNSDINDKEKAETFKLAERIVEQDTQAIEKADIYIIDLPTADAGGRGTVAEIGQIYQMKRDAVTTYNTIGDKYGIYSKEGNTKENTKFNDMYVAPNDVEHMQELLDIVNRPCFVYSDDVRWNTTDMNDIMDRVPYSFNAYTYGLVMSITKGKGVQSWESIIKELENIV